MISDFDLLSQKVDELAQLAQALRRENAGLRAGLALADAEKDELARRMLLAQQRVAALLSRLPPEDPLGDPAVLASATGPSDPITGAGADHAALLDAAPAALTPAVLTPAARKAVA